MLYPIELWVPLVPINLQAHAKPRKRFERRFVRGCITSLFDHESRFFESVFAQGHAEAGFGFELRDAFGKVESTRVEGWELAVIHFAEFPVGCDKTEMNLRVKAQF